MPLKWTAPQRVAPSTAVFEWSAEYAAVVHNGATLRNGGKIPARPWTVRARQELDLVDQYVQAYKRTKDLGVSLRQTAIAYDRKMAELINQKVWDWPNTTRRRSGEIAKSPRDIVDTKALANSQSLRFES